MPEDRFGEPTPSDRGEPAEDRLLDELIAAEPRARAERLEDLSVEAPDLAARARSVLSELDTNDGFLAPGGALVGPLFGELCEDLSLDQDRPASLAAGASVGPYRIVERVGVGGMGEVYRASDATLGRDVAIKVLGAHLEEQEGLAAHLQREARLLAALNHPNIATVLGLEHIGDRLALVMEFVEGPTLAERLRQRPMTVPEVVGIARQLVAAIEAAHGRGVVHRDLKPGNVKIAASGHLKVLDFGIARVLRDDTGAVSSSGSPPLTTLPWPAGTVVGTASYMSPEQVRGEAIDQRTDIWAFGCVLFEMLTRRRAFDGNSSAEVMARVLERSPAFELLPAGTPGPLRELIEGCLQKDPAARLPEIGEARTYLDATPSSLSTPPSERPWRGPGAWRRWLSQALPAALGLALGAGVSGLLVWSLVRPPLRPVARLTVPVPAADVLVAGALPAVAISPDGTTVAYRARRDGRLLLFVRSLGEAEPGIVQDSENGMAPFFSPDGAWLGFDRDGVLMKVPVAGGAPASICETGGASSTASWSDRGEIVFGTTTGHGLMRVPASGGRPVPLTTVDQARGEVLHATPDVLPGGRAALFTILADQSSTIAAVRLDTGEVIRITEGRQARYFSSGHLLVVRGDGLWAARFDAGALRLRGELVPVLKGLDANGAAHFAVAHNGWLAYVPPADLDPVRDIVWLDREGREQPSGIQPGRYLRLSLSPDGARVALVVADTGGQDLWVHDLARRSLTRLTFDPHVDTAPVWAPDGRTIAFRSERDGGGLFRIRADGTGRPERLATSSGVIHTPYAFTPDGRELLYTEFRSYRDQGIGRLLLDGAPAMKMIIDEPFAELRPSVSPNGQWLAYQSDETGEFEVYVRPYPDVDGGKWRVSRSGGKSPQWGAAGDQLFYFEGDTLVRVPLLEGHPPVAGSPERLFSAPLFGERLGPIYSVSPDGSRFLVIKPEDERDRVSTRRQLLLVQNWDTELATLLDRAR